MRQYCLPFVIIITMKLYTCQRRLVNGAPVVSEKRFLAYLVSSNMSQPHYDSWICGGAIVSPYQILTSAACLTTLSHIYAIAGYRKYVNGRGIDYDECTKRKKQKVISYCIPQNYTLNQNVSSWPVLDVGVAVVEKPFDFADVTWKRYCSWIPGSIRVSYMHQEKNTDVVAFGWGGDVWRSPIDIRDPNRENLYEIYSMIADKSLCRSNNLNNEIYKWIYCVSGEGNLDGDGNQFEVGMTDRNGWNDGYEWDNRRIMSFTTAGYSAISSEKTTHRDVKAVADKTLLFRRQSKTKTANKPIVKKPAAQKPTTKKPATVKPTAKKPAAVNPTANKPIVKNPAAQKPTTKKPATVKPTAKKPAGVNPKAKVPVIKNVPVMQPTTKKPATQKSRSTNGPKAKTTATTRTIKPKSTFQTPATQNLALQNPAVCTGDHGGPLVTWEGNEMVLVGLAVSSIINTTTNGCTKPSLFISTHCAGLVIDCLLALTPTALRSCNDLSKKDGTFIMETNVDWNYRR